MGLRSEWRHNRAGFIGKTAAVGVGLLALYVLIRELQD
jgi:hypothetical protein